MNTTTADARSATVTGRPQAGQLRRSADDKMLAGVAGGIARYLNTDVTLIRIIIAALVLFTGADADACLQLLGCLASRLHTDRRAWPDAGN